MYVRSITVRAFALPCKKKKAVLSIEAALIIPFFLMVSITLMTLLSVYYINGRIEAAVNEEAKYIARNHYQDGYSEAAAKVDIVSRLGDRFINSNVIKDGIDGFDFSDTDLSLREVVIISVKYTIVPPFDMFSMLEIPMEKRTIIHTWTGYINGLNGMYSESEYVYMAKNGTVYHRSRECTHIRLSIRAVELKALKNLRNEKGAKYKRCEYCHPKKSDEKLYITTDGDKYHNTLMCSGLKRSIIRVRLNDIGDIPPCSRCAH